MQKLTRKNKLIAQKLEKIFNLLHQTYGEQHCFLDHETPFQLLIAVILSAQCTDKVVNQNTPALFDKYPTAHHLAKADLKKVQALIKAIGLYKAKSQYIIGTAQGIVERFDGEVPFDIEALVTLPGVGRKTANVILADIYDGTGFAVDTHVKRLLNRIGIVDSDSPEAIEHFVKSIFPHRELLGQLSLLLITHGRNSCSARKPLCDTCCLREECQKRI